VALGIVAAKLFGLGSLLRRAGIVDAKLGWAAAAGNTLGSSSMLVERSMDTLGERRSGEVKDMLVPLEGRVGVDISMGSIPSCELPIIFSNRFLRISAGSLGLGGGMASSPSP